MSTITYIVKVASGKFTIDDAVAPKLTFRDGDTYIFDQSDGSNAGHILQFSATSNNSGSSEYTTGVTKTGTAGQAGAKTTIVTSSSTTDTLYYYSSGGGEHGREFSNTGFNTSANYNVLKPIVGSSSTAEKWGAMVNHAIDQIDLQAKDNRDYTDQHAFQGEPHIIPDTLYPAVAGKLLDGSTSHSGAYGTAQSDGRMYYYTDIKGSKPIKDPRIGSHFGSQRHKFKSIQLLEQETATHGANVYSVDGREWVRAVGSWDVINGAHGVFLQKDNAGAADFTNYIEYTGYFNRSNFLAMSYDDTIMNISIDGTVTSDFAGNDTTVNSPLTGRYVDAGSVISLPFTPTLGIHTVRIGSDSNQVLRLFGIELIAQDTTSTATKSKIQIPAQNVVSYGKKFAIPATAQHYNPFATKGDGSASTIPNNTTGDSVATGWTGSTSAYWDSTLDTATSLGLGAWESGGNFYRPVNGGRVVKWVDSSGNIKTSVNMMPPEASLGTRFANNGSGTSPATGTHNWSTVYQPKFGNKTIGSNLITSWINGENSNALPYDTTFTTSGANITEADSDGTLSYAKTNAFTLTKGKTYRLTILHADVGSGGEAPLFMITTDDTSTKVPAGNDFLAVTENANNQWVFVSDVTASTCKVFAKNTATAEWSANTTLYEIEQPEAQAEVAKTFHWREFGNGSANGNSNYADASTLNSADDIGYVMDDGLTSMSGKGVHTQNITTNGGLRIGGNSQSIYWTFIGTGISQIRQRDNSTTEEPVTWAQNLPYGTHICQITRDSSANQVVKVDGVTIETNSTSDKYLIFGGPTIHQPKMPPIPQDACIISDYMLMADWVEKTANTFGLISKGARLQSGSRDVFYDKLNLDNREFANPAYTGGFFATYGSTYTGGSTGEIKLPFFGTTILHQGYNSVSGNDMYIDGVDVDQGGVTSGTTYAFIAPDALSTLGQHTYMVKGVSGVTYAPSIMHLEIATPIHTSSHYQPFETPFLYELVGGDRNMEQNNMIVTPDGKSWDEVTRDTSYIGNLVLSAQSETNGWINDSSTTTSTIIALDMLRGTFGMPSGGTNTFMDGLNKDWAIAYDRYICLVDGTYEIRHQGLVNGSNDGYGARFIEVNGKVFMQAHRPSTTTSDYDSFNMQITYNFKRGDYITMRGRTHGDQYGNFQIRRV